MFRWLGAGALTIVVVVVILIVIAVPLFLVYRSDCPDQGEFATNYNVVLPWNDPPQECRDHQSGYEIIADEVGL